MAGQVEWAEGLLDVGEPEPVERDEVVHLRSPEAPVCVDGDPDVGEMAPNVADNVESPWHDLQLDLRVASLDRSGYCADHICGCGPEPDRRRCGDRLYPTADLGGQRHAVVSRTQRGEGCVHGRRCARALDEHRLIGSEDAAGFPYEKLPGLVCIVAGMTREWRSFAPPFCLIAGDTNDDGATGLEGAVARDEGPHQRQLDVP